MNLRKLFIILVLVSIVVGVGFARGAKEETGGPFPISIMNISFSPETPTADSLILQMIEVYTNTDLDYTFVPSSFNYEEKVSATLASGDVPDILNVREYKRPDIIAAIRAGFFWEVGPYFQEFDNLAAVDPNVVKNALLDGELYGIVKARDLARNCIMARKDWMDNLGLDMPKNLEDVYEIARAFVYDDPDNNGKDDTIALNLRPNIYFLPTYASWMGAGPEYSMRDGKMMPEFMHPAYLETLKWWRRMYEEKLIPQDFAVNSKQGNLFYHDAVMGMYNASLGVGYAYQESVRKVVPDAEIIPFMLLEGPDGEIHIRQEGKGNAGMFMFNTNTVKDETHLKKLLGFLDTMQEPEMQLLCRFGLEGVHYEQQEDGIEVIDRNRIGVEVDPFQQLWTQYEDLVTLAVVPEISKYEEEIRKEANKHLEVNPITPLISETMVEKGPSLKQIIDDASVKYIMGEIDDAGWQTAIDRWLREGGQNVIDEYTTEYNKVH